MEFNDIILNKELTISAINRRSTANIYKDLKVGDKIRLEFPFKLIGVGNYLKKLKTINLQNGEFAEHKYENIVRTLNCFEFEEE